MKSTPGPWTDGRTADSVVAPNGGGPGYTPEQYNHVLDWYGGEVICESVAPNNKPLIKTAPELLAAAKEAYDAMLRRYDAGEDGDFWNEATARLHAAIAAAEPAGAEAAE